MSSIKFGMIGGDYRYKMLYDMLIRDGYSVKVFENEFIESKIEYYDEMLRGIDVLIAPIPCTKDDKIIFLTSGEKIEIDKLFENMYKEDVKIFIGGVITKNIQQQAIKYNIKTFDYFEQEDIAVLNAIPTAEGAIQTAMQESDRTIFASKAIVIGYGRCGKILSNMLKGIGAKVTVTFRNDKDAAYIKAYGLKGFNISELKSYIHEYDFIFNTAPAEVIDKEILKRINKNAVIIDLAQAPGGVDFNFARDINIKALYCPGLPGRVAPYTAAKILKEAILNISLSNIKTI